MFSHDDTELNRIVNRTEHDVLCLDVIYAGNRNAFKSSGHLTANKKATRLWV